MIPKHLKLPGERWRHVPGFEGYYAISDHGRIWSCEREIYYARGRGYTATRGGFFLSPGGKYPSASLAIDNEVPQQLRINRLVASVFLKKPPPHKDIVMHKDDNPKNNHYKNLRWGTVQDNVDDKVAKERQCRGIKNGRAVLTEKDVKVIRRALTRGTSRKLLAEQHQVSKATIDQIAARRIWSHI